MRDRLNETVATGLTADQQLRDSLAANSQRQESLKADIESARAKSVQVTADINGRDAHIQETENRIEDERRLIGSLARVVYLQPDSTLMRLLRAGSLKDAVLTTADMAAAANRGEKLKAALDHDLMQLNEDQAKQQSDLQELAGLQQQEQSDVQTLSQLQSEQQATSQLLSEKISETRQELQAVGSQQPAVADRVSQELDREIGQIIELANQQVWRQVNLHAQANPIAPTSQSQGHSTRSPFIWPMPTGPITQGFGPSALWFEPAFNGFAHFHTGIDIAGPENGQVLAADDGQVVLAATGSSGYGNYVVLAHGNGMTTLYGHLNGILVSQGDRVRQGQAIGLEGSTGYSTGPHVHFEVRDNGIPIDPSPFLPPGPPSATRA